MSLLTPMITASGWIYSNGSVHQHNGQHFGRPMYYPDPSGNRSFRGLRYSKFNRSVENANASSHPYPRCWQIDPWSVLLPKMSVAEVVDTHSALCTWLSGNDPRVGIVKKILSSAYIPLKALGLGGSTGLGCDSSDSDVDLIIYGSRYVGPCRTAIEDALLAGDLSLMTHDVVATYAARYACLYGLNREYLHAVFAHDITKVYRNGRKISFIFAYHDDESKCIPAQLYQSSDKPRSEVKIRARVIDGSGTWLYPRKYTVVGAVDQKTYDVWSHHWLRDPITATGALVEIVGNRIADGIISLTELYHKIAPLGA